MRQEAASQWRNSSATDKPMDREWASRQNQKGGGKAGGERSSERGGLSDRGGEKRRSGPQVTR
jgi:hypothetical protein